MSTATPFPAAPFPAAPVPAASVPQPRMSDAIDQVLLARAMAQQQLFAPLRNKTATISPKRGPAYTFRYTSLDVLIELVKHPLFEAGLTILPLVATDGAGRTFLVSRLVHIKSGQWIECTFPLVVDDRDGQGAMPQAYGAGSTYLRRYAIAVLLDLASEEDTDGSAASGQGFQSGEPGTASGEDAERHAGRQAGDLYRKLVHVANHASTPEAVLDLLKVWQRGMGNFLAMRDQPANEGEWANVVELVAGALGRVHGQELGDLWRRMCALETLKDLEALRLHWAGLGAAKEAMRRANPKAFGALNEQLVTAAHRIEEAVASAEAFDRTAAPGKPASPPANTPTSTLAGAPTAPATGPAWQPVHLLDDAGDVTGEEIEDAQEFVRQYGEILTMTGINHQALAEHNAEALAACRELPAAAMLLDSYERLASSFGNAVPAAVPSPALPAVAPQPLAECAPPAPPPVPTPVPPPAPSPAPMAAVAASLPVPDTAPAAPLLAGLAATRIPLGLRGGAPDVVGYNVRVRRAVFALSADDLAPWMSANGSTYNGAPEPMRLKVLQYLAERARELGVTLPSTRPGARA